MSHDEQIIWYKGTIRDVFAHRFVVETADGKILADLSKHNLEKITVKAGDQVELTGEQKPSELKVKKIILNGKAVALEQKDKDHRKHKEKNAADPALAIYAAQKENVTVIGKPHRKPQHFEVLGKSAQGEWIELHVELDGRIRKSKLVKSDDEKWIEEISAA